MNMKFIIPLILVVLVLIAFILYKPREHFTGDGDKIVLYYSPNCGHCHKLMPTWDKFNDSMNSDKSIVLSKINCASDKNKCTDVVGYPTIKFFKKDGGVIEFNGERTLNALEKFANINRS